jgi:hypothetical protein
MSEDRNGLTDRLFLNSNFPRFEFVSDFEIQISSFRS